MNMPMLFKQINDFSIEIPRPEFIENLKKLEAVAYQLLTARNTVPWRRGNGLAISGILSRLKDTIIKKVVAYTGGIPAGITLVAVGGYGREELSPYSDIDLLLLHQPQAPIADFAAKFLYLLWDMKYQVSSSTRTIENLREQAWTDETFLTSLFGARFLAGELPLFYKIGTNLARLLPSLRKSLLRTQIKEIYSIFSNFNQEAPHKILLKEPNIKTNSGGLRSVHMMIWLNYAFHRKPGLTGLNSCLDANQFKKLHLAYDFLLYVRNMLHFLQKRKEDFLYLDYHLEIAQYLHLPGDDINKISCLLKHYHRQAMTILLAQLCLTESLAQTFLKSWRTKNMFFSSRRDQRYTVQDERFFITQGLSPSIPEALDLLYICTANHYHPSYSFLKYLQDVTTLFETGEETGFMAGTLNNQSISQENYFSLFVKILMLDNAYDALNAMKLSGFLYKLVPPFNLIKHLLIYNPFHKYTIDQHSLEAVGALESLFSLEVKETEKTKYFLLKEVAEQYKENSWLIKLSLLLHDTGKAYPGDHTKNSVEIAWNWFQSVPIPATYKQVIVFLIKNHLLLSQTARRSDMDNTQIFTNLAREFFLTPFPIEYLDALFLITYADVYATNPKNYSSYAASRLNHVFNETSELLLAQTDSKYSTNRLPYMITRISQILSSTNRPNWATQTSDTNFAVDFVQSMGEQYSLNNDESEIIQDLKNIMNFTKDESRKEEKFHIEVKSYNDYFKVKFFASDRLGLFSHLAGILTLNGADIVRADIHTYKGIALDEFYILQIFNTELTEKSMREQLKHWKADLEKLHKRYHHAYPSLVQHIKDFKPRVKKLQAVFHRPTELKLEITDKPDTTARTSTLRLEISCTDRPALLFDICSCLADHHYAITGAIIDTSGWYVKDIFKLRSNVHPDQNKLQELIAALHTAIET